MIPRIPPRGNTGSVVNPRDRPRPAGRRNPVEAIAQQVTERVVDLLVSVLDVNELGHLLGNSLHRISPACRPQPVARIHHGASIRERSQVGVIPGG
jgi:hypothetical protein